MEPGLRFASSAPSGLRWLLDEPTQGMGREDVERVTGLIERAAANRTVLMERFVSRYCHLAETSNSISSFFELRLRMGLISMSVKPISAMMWTYIFSTDKSSP